MKSVRRYARVVWAVAAKDFRLEARAKRALPMAAALSLLVVVVFAFAFEGRHDAGAVWVAFVFAGTLGVMQSVGIEGENDALDGLLLAPVPTAAIYVGKVVSAAVYVSLVGLFTVLATRVFLGTAPTAPIPVVVLVVLLFAVGFAAVAVVIAAMTIYTTISDLLVPVLLVPLIIPALLAGIALFGAEGWNWLTVLVGYDGIVFTAGLLVFEELVA